MSKKPRKKPSKQAKEPVEDFWDLGDDDLELTLEGVGKEKKPTEEKKEKKTTPPKKAASSKKASSKQKNRKTTKSEDSDVESGKDKEPSKSEKSKSSEDKAKKSASPKKSSSKKKQDPEIKAQKPDREPDKEPRKSKNSESQPKKQKLADIEDDLEEFDLDSLDLENDRSEPVEYKSSQTAQTEVKSVRKKEETGSRFAKEDVTPTTITEKISLLILVACLIGALVWGISTFLKDAPQGEVISFKEDYPAKGQHITISSVETWWKKPIRSGENADVGIVLEANLVPCAKITLSEGGSTSLRVTFRNGDKELIGDTINLTVENGKFARNGSDTVEVYSTAGFTNASEINAYANGDIAPWSLSITEGDSGNDVEALVKARISADSKTP